MTIEKYFTTYRNPDVAHWGYNSLSLWTIKHSVNTTHLGGMLHLVRSTHLYRKNINIYKISTIQ